MIIVKKLQFYYNKMVTNVRKLSYRSIARENEEVTESIVGVLTRDDIGRFFYDFDHIDGENHYVWHGTFDEILEEFRETEYIFSHEEL